MVLLCTDALNLEREGVVGKYIGFTINYQNVDFVRVVRKVSLETP